MDDLKKFKILIVDDEETIRNTLIFDFKRKGFTVLSAENGTQAFEMMRTEKIDLVLSDIRMPGGDGISLLERLRKENPLTPVLIFISGFADLTAEECIAKGARKVFSKPFDRKALMQTVLQELGALSQKAG